MTELRREFHRREPIRRPPFALLSACLLALAPGLSGSAGEAGDVKSAAADTLEMREAAGIVLRDGPAPLLHPGDLEVSSDGTVAVLDERDYAVKLFAPDGSFLRTLGARGTGRGQLAHPSAMTFVGDSLVAVADDQRLKLLLFGISGELQREVDLRIRPVNDLLFVDGRFVVGGLGPLVSSRDEVPYTVHHLGPDGTLLRSSFPVPPRFREPPALRNQRLALLAPKPGGGFYVTWRLADSVHAVDGGGHILRSRSLDASPYYRPGRQVAARAEGGPGGGPGELDEPGGVALEPGGVLTVMDFGKRGLVRYDTSGRALPTRRLDVPYSGDRIAGTERGLVFTTLRGYRGEDRKVEDRLVLLTGEDSSEVVATLRKERPRMVDYSGCVRITLPPLFEREIVWDARGDRIVWQVGERYRITVLEADGDRLSLRRRTPVREIDRETALAQLGEGAKVTTPEGTCRLDPEEQLEGRGFHSTLPPLERLVLTPSGGVWAVRYALRGEEPAVDLFDPEGGYVGTLPPGTPVPVVFLSADTFLAEETDEVGVERLVSYRILRRG